MIKLSTRQDAYLWILSFGLSSMRNISQRLPHYTDIESDHLHNIPDYANNELNEKRHHYYLDCEITIYLNKLHKYNYFSDDSIIFVIERYKDAWNILLKIAQQVDAPEPATKIFPAWQHHIGRPGDL